MRFHREEYLDLMTFVPGARPMFLELFGTLVGLDDEWRAQGATEDEIALTAFDWDYVPIVDFGGYPLPRGAAPVTIEDTPEQRVQRDFLGRTLLLLKKTATHALPMNFPVQTMDDWLRVKPYYEFTPDRINWDEVAAARKAREEGALIRAYMPGAFDMPRDLMGEEIACLAYYEQPELMADIMATLADTMRRVLEPISAVLTIDQLSVHEDFAGKSGPLVGPIQIKEHFRPYYRAIWEPLADRGAKIFQVDTDGNINVVIPALLDCGVTCIYPMEPAAGMDMVEVRRQYGHRLMMLGGIDKHVLRLDREAIRRELEYKLQPLMREGGCAFGLDHQIPNGTSIENYRYYVDLGREILGLPPRDPSRKGWARMGM
ncbi:MAG: uroporphyrinogen decarboxylase family protein [Opitutales bacterium]